MKNVGPAHSDTVVNTHAREWLPCSFETFLVELNHIVTSCRQADSLALFRGHRKREWLLDSTFVRSCKWALFGVPAEAKFSKMIVASIELHRILLNLYLLKYGVLVRPSDQLELIAERDGVDAWFELMKRYQQYPEEDLSDLKLKGSNLLDWTQSPEVALYFANDKRNGDGAIYICDATATGKTLQVMLVGAILDKMNEVGNAGQALRSPLLFYPAKQIRNQRANNQQAAYFAQMDLRFDLETLWRSREAELSNETIVIKLVLPAGSEGVAREYLSGKGINDVFIYPDQ